MERMELPGPDVPRLSTAIASDSERKMAAKTAVVRVSRFAVRGRT